jgi:hypothetical protein
MAMTEAKWLACTDPQPMLEFLRDKASARKLRLFAVACCRRVWHLLIDERSRLAVEVAEHYADGLLLEDEAQTAFNGACEASRLIRRNHAAETMLQLRRHRDPDQLFRIAFFAAFAVGNGVSHMRPAYGVDPVTQSNFLREICGNPLRAATINPAWRTANATALAQSIYADRAFERLPILADALEDAGCDDADILSHCRQPGEHVRGCWVVDLLLEKR